MDVGAASSIIIIILNEGDVFLLFFEKRKVGDRGESRLTLNLTASTLIAFNRTSRINVDFSPGFCGGTRWWANAILDLRCHCHEGLFDICRVLGGCLEEWNSELVGVFLKKQHKICYLFNHVKTSTRSLTVAVVVSTTFFVVKSHLLPTSSLFTFSHA
jgi:hypothetical protein